MIATNLPKAIPYDGKTLKTIGIYSKNREEWLITDIACWYCSVTCVPLYDTLGEESIAWIFEQTELSTVFTTASNIGKLLAMKQKKLVPALENIVSYDECTPEILKNTQDAGLKLFEFSKLLQNPPEITLTPTTPETLLTICYTSGTTAKCKGVEITQRNFFSDATAIRNSGTFEFPTERTLFSYLPLAHVFERVVTYFGLMVGFKVAFYHGDILKLAEDIEAAKPSIFVGVPRVFGRFYDVIMGKINSLTGLKKKLALAAIESKTEKYKTSGKYTDWFYDSFVLDKVRKSLGGNVKLFVSASAPIDPNMLIFFKIMFSCDVLQGYGQTETAGAISISHYKDNDPSVVGGPLHCCKCKVVDVPEMNYRSTDIINGISVPRGELCVKGYNVTKRYFKDPEKTKELFDEDGWMHTGDIVCLNNTGSIKIIDRRKNMFKLAQGEYVAPEKVENLLVNTQWVAQIFVYGDSFQTYLVAIVVPKKDSVLEWAKSKSIFLYYNLKIKDLNNTYDELCANKELNEIIVKDLAEIGKKGKVFF